MQNAQQVVQALFGRGTITRMGVFDSPWPYTLRKWIGQGYPTNERGEPVEPTDHFEFDLAGCGGWFDILPLRGFKQVEQETDEWKIERNGAGAALKWWKNKYGTPEHIDFRMTSRAVWERDYRPHMLALDPARVDVAGNGASLKKRRAEGYWTYFGNLFVWENMRRSLGDVCMYESMALDPDWIHDYCRVHTDFFKLHYGLLFEQAGLPDGMWVYEDMGYRDRVFCSPDMFGRLIFPYFRELVDWFHSYGLPVVLHTCGFTEPLLDLIVEAGFDGLNPMEVKAGNDPLRIARRCKDRLVLIGGLDARVLESHDHGLIRREVAKLCGGMKSIGARFVFASDHSISTNVNYDDFQCAQDEFRKHMHY